MKKFSKVEKLLFGLSLVALIGLGVRRYLPTVDYAKYRIQGGQVMLKDDLVIKLNEGWFPVSIDEEQDRAHVTFVRIDPWFPQRYISEIDIIYKPNFVNDRNGNAILGERKQYAWGQIVLFKGQTGESNLAITPDGKIRIYFDRLNDLDEIKSISKKRT